VTSEAAGVADRLAGIEKRYRRLRNLGCVVVAFLGVSLLLGLAKPKSRVLEAESIVLRDEGGHIRARLEAKGDLQGIAFFDKKGEVRYGLSLAPDGSPGICLYDENGLGRVMLEKGFGDSWSLGFFSAQGKDVAVLGVDFKGNPYLHLFDKAGQKIWSAP
jgi:hypothetical protein